jgi:hypothetical protein
MVGTVRTDSATMPVIYACALQEAMLLRVAVLFSLAFCRMILLMIAAMGL